MKFIEAREGKFNFQVEPKERQLLLKVLELYPLVPAVHQRLSKSTGQSEDQQLLDDALAAQRGENKKLLAALVQNPAAFHEQDDGWHLTLDGAEMEWLLQVLNDIRVGSWLLLGSPDGPAETVAALNAGNAQYFWAHELAGHFEISLLRAMSGEEDSAADE